MSEGKKGFFGRLVEGLAKTRNNIVSGIDSIFSGFSAIDDDFYEEIEETLIMGDLGIQTTMSIVEDLRAKVKEQHIKEEVFEYVCDLLLKDGSITSKEAFKQDLYIRESQGKTGIGDGIAIPHGKSAAVKRNCISVLKLERPIQWETLDGLPVQVFIVFAINQRDKDDYFLRLMASVAKKLAQEGTCKKLMGSSTKEDILEAFC